MRKIVITFLYLLIFIASGCRQTAEKQTKPANNAKNIQDTTIVKHKDALNEFAWYSKSYSYYWLAGKDTLDFILYVSESKENGDVHLRLYHKTPILFTTVLKNIEASLPLIKKDFDLSKLESIGFREPIFYLDLAKKLSDEYEQEFGRKNVTYKKFVQFLLHSGLNSQINEFLNPLHKRVKHYGFEKFFLIDKESYKNYLPNVDFTEYPEFTFNAHTGIYLDLENKQ
ncbi:MAG: hypothetical protein LBR60_07975 [Fibrobacter sp.]|jgi:hypothetical protein|nr:hypothetical protein [Fibrobacter sp.]